ncbi:MAG: IclR family transcriptional regulator [Anaerolineaceae bacterium]|nr:MAG: IclR family transcriptional regulator [Anaerolineaceae bacterium]
MGDNKTNHRSTSRVLDILELISNGNNEGYTLTEIASKLNVPKSSLFPMLHTLLDRQYLSLDANQGKYCIGMMLFQVGSSYLDNFNIMNDITTELQNITNVCAEASHFAILNNGNIIYLAKIDSPEPIRMISSVGKSLPAYGTGLGKSLLMDHSINELRRLYPDGLKPMTQYTVTDFDLLDEQLSKARQCGFAYEVEESNLYIRCISIPIRQNNKIVAAISVAVPTFRYTQEKADLIQHLLLNAKHRLESILKTIYVDFNNLT